MVKKIVFIMKSVSGPLLLTFLMTGCFLFEPLYPYLGRLLPVDEQGHFKEEIIYKDGSSTYTLNPDGTYEMKTESYEDTGEDADGDGTTGEGWVIVSGFQGTYSWAENRVLEWTPDSEIVDGEWVSLSDAPTYTRGYYFTEQTYGIAWIFGGDLDGCRDEFTIINSDGTSDMTEISWTWGESTSTTITILEKDYVMDAGGNVVSGTEVTREGTFVVFPEGTKIKEGNAFTFHATITGTDDGLGTYSEDQYIYSKDFFHAGDFFVEWLEPTAQRGFYMP